MEFATLQPGDTIAERYELIGKIGAGAFGAVFKARQLGIDRQVALKLLMPEADIVDSTAVARFKREAKLSSSLEHPNTITIHDYGEWQGILYLVMEYVRGLSLHELLKKEGRLDPERARHISVQILSSLNEAHSRGIIHRDMKPANIMLFDRFSEKDVVKVLDFGIAKFMTNDNEGMGPAAAQEDLTVAGRIVGTPRYMAPEQVKGISSSPTSDIYGLGLILYEMIAGRKAITGDSTMSLIAMQLSSAPAIQQDDPLVPPRLMPVILKATHKDPDQRYQTAKEFSEALEAVDLILTSPPPLPRHISPPPSPDGIELDAEMEALMIAEPSGPAKGLIVAALILAAFILIGGAAFAIPMLLGDGDSEREAAALAAASDAAEAPKAPKEAPVQKAAEPEPTPEPVADTPPELTLNITTTPEGAAIMKGDDELGVSPITLRVNPTEAQALKVILDGYEDGEIAIVDSMDPAVVITMVRKPVKRPVKTNNVKTDKVEKPDKGGSIYKPL